MSKPIRFAVSRLVNTDGVEPKLTEEQLWKGLERKARQPELFIPMAIASSEVNNDAGNSLTRSITLKSGQSIVESITLHEKTIIYFDSPPPGHRVTNVISYNEQGEMVLTFSFADGIPGFPPTETRPSVSELNQKVGQAVEHTLEVIRKLVAGGEI